MHVQGWETRLGRRSAVLDQNIFPAREIGRFGLHAETDRGLRSVLNLLCITAIPIYRLNCSGGVLRALASLRVCWPVCLHGETWLPSVLLGLLNAVPEVSLSRLFSCPIFLLTFEMDQPARVGQTRVLILGGRGLYPRGQPRSPSVAC